MSVGGFRVMLDSEPPTWQDFGEPWSWQLMQSGMLQVFHNVEIPDNPLAKRYEYRVKAVFPPGAWLCVIDDRLEGQVRYRPGVEREE